MTGIYCIENQTNGKKYVGQAVNIEKRWRQHRNKLINGTHYNEHLQRAWNLYGESSFSFYVLEICSEESLDAREIYYIKSLNSFENGYNMTLGGEGTRGCLHTEEYKKHMSELSRGRKFSEETLKKMSLAKKGKKHESTKTEATIAGYKIVSEKLKGRSFSVEHKKHLSESLKGKTPWNKGMSFSKESHPLYGKNQTDETKRKIGNANRGKIRTQEQKDKISKKIVCVETGEVYRSISEAALRHGVSIHAISNVLRGKTKTSACLHWVYAETEVN